MELYWQLVSAALVEQPTVKAVFHSLRDVLSSSVRLHGADLYLLNSGREILHLLEFDRAANAPAIRIGTKISRIGAAAQALEQQEPVFLPDLSREIEQRTQNVLQWGAVYNVWLLVLYFARVIISCRPSALPPSRLFAVH